jgi:hypothetical protein
MRSTAKANARREGVIWFGKNKQSKASCLPREAKIRSITKLPHLLFFSATILPKFSTFPPYPSDPSEKKQDGGLTATVTVCRKASVGVTLGTIVLGIGEIVIVDLRGKL